MRNRTGKPVLGVIPMMRDINIPEEDRATLPPGHGEHGKHADCLDVAVVMPAHVSNFTDFAPLAGGAGRPAPPGADTGGMGKSGPGHSARH